MTYDGRSGSPAEKEFRTNLGAYVLGQLDAAAAARLEDHLRGCDECRAELEELRPVASALRDLRAGAVARRPSPRPAIAPRHDTPPDLGARVVSRVSSARREQRVARHRALGIGAAGGAAVAASLIGGLVVLTSDDGAPAKKIPIETVAVQVKEQGVTADADIVAHTWGVEVKLAASGFVRGEVYRVAVVRRDGERSAAGEFVGTGAVRMLCNLNSSVLRPTAEGFEVRDDQGQVVVVSHFH